MQITITGATVRRALAVLVTVAALAAAGYAAFRVASQDAFGSAVDPNRYQSVTLMNGRLYIGHLRDARGDFYVVTDAYFIRQAAGASPGPDGQVPQQVARLREQFHGPESRTLVRKDAVLNVENLRSDSAVVKAIRDVERAGGR